MSLNRTGGDPLARFLSESDDKSSASGTIEEQTLKAVDGLRKEVGTLNEKMGALVHILEKIAEPTKKGSLNRFKIAKYNRKAREENFEITRDICDYYEMTPLLSFATGDEIEHFPCTIDDMTSLGKDELITLIKEMGLEPKFPNSLQDLRIQFRDAVGLSRWEKWWSD